MSASDFAFVVRVTTKNNGLVHDSDRDELAGILRGALSDGLAELDWVLAVDINDIEDTPEAEWTILPPLKP